MPYLPFWWKAFKKQAAADVKSFVSLQQKFKLSFSDVKSRVIAVVILQKCINNNNNM